MIDYEEEVKKIYPKSYVHSRVVRDWAYEIRTPKFLIFSKSICRETFLREKVWQIAFEEIKFKNK